MEAPDKVYLDIIEDDDIHMIAPSFKDNGGVEYIRKDALLKKISEARAIPHDGAIWRDRAFAEIITIINEM